MSPTEQPPLLPLRIPAGWVVRYNELRQIDPDQLDPSDPMWVYMNQDLMQIESREEPGLMINVGWYPAGHFGIKCSVEISRSNNGRGAMTELELAAVRALTGVATGEVRFEQFMALAAKIARVPGSHEEFIATTAPVIAAQLGRASPLERWAGRISRAVGFGNEDDAIGAVKLRSQLEFVCDLYLGSAADAAFEEQHDSETDDALAQLAKDFGIDAEPGIPYSHRWWRWPAGKSGEP